MKTKQLLLIAILSLFMISCSTNSDPVESETSLTGKWAFGPGTECGRDMIEFKNTNVFVEYHHSSENCSLIPYYGEYILTGDLIEINGNQRVITSLTSEALDLYDPASETSRHYDKVHSQ